MNCRKIAERTHFTVWRSLTQRNNDHHLVGVHEQGWSNCLHVAFDFLNLLQQTQFSLQRMRAMQLSHTPYNSSSYRCIETVSLTTNKCVPVIVLTYFLSSINANKRITKQPYREDVCMVKDAVWHRVVA